MRSIVSTYCKRSVPRSSIFFMDRGSGDESLKKYPEHCIIGVDDDVAADVRSSTVGAFPSNNTERKKNDKKKMHLPTKLLFLVNNPAPI